MERDGTIFTFFPFYSFNRQQFKRWGGRGWGARRRRVRRTLFSIQLSVFWFCVVLLGCQATLARCVKNNTVLNRSRKEWCWKYKCLICTCNSKRKLPVARWRIPGANECLQPFYLAQAAEHMCQDLYSSHLMTHTIVQWPHWKLKKKKNNNSWGRKKREHSAWLFQPLKEKEQQLGGSMETGVRVVMVIINRGCDFCRLWQGGAALTAKYEPGSWS